MTRKNDDNGDAARVAELELENEELKQRLAQREHDTAEIADALEAAQHNGAGPGIQPGMQANTYLALLWGLIGAWLVTWIVEPDGGLAWGIVSVLVTGFSFILTEKWIRAERRNGLGVVILKSIGLAAGLFIGVVILGGGKIITDNGNAQDHPVLALFWLSFVMLAALSRLAEWVSQGIAAFVDDPILTMRGWFVKSASEEPGESYDGFREN